MFDIVAGTAERPLRERTSKPTAVSILLHVIVVTLLIGLPLLRVKTAPPPVPTLMAFVAAPPAPPPPPPPPAAAPPPAEHPAPRPVERSSGAIAAPSQAPADIKPEATTGSGSGSATGATGGVAGGVEGGIEGGVVGGIVGGVVGGVVANAPPPPPPPAPPAGPVRVGGQIRTPALLHRVEPVYPDIAAIAQLSGMVILEAVVNTDGCVESVKVLRSRHELLDRAAVDALKQWRYTPLVLNGIPTPFVLTVTFTFSAK